MKKNKKGFTLIELLAVIVVLAIILVIAVPRVLKVIEDARKESLGKSAQMAAKHMQQDYALQVLSGTVPEAKTEDTACPATAGVTEGTCTYTSASNASTGELDYTVKIVGSGKFTGWTATSVNGNTANVTESEQYID